MAKRKRSESVESIDPALGGEDDRAPKLPGSEVVDAQSEFAAQEVEGVLQALGSGARVKIYRVSLETGAPAFVGALPAANFTEEVLAETYGGGKYILKVNTGGENPQELTLYPEIDPTIPPRNPRAPRGAQGSGSGQELLMQIMAEGARQSQRSMEVMTTMMGGFATAMATLMSSKREDKDPLDMARQLIELTRPNTPVPAARSLVHEIREAQQVATMLGAGNDGLMPVIGEGIKAIVEIAKRAPVQTGIPRNPVTPIPPRTPRPPAPIVEVVPPIQTPTPPVAMVEPRKWVMAIQPHLELLRSAVGTMEPTAVAGIITQRLSPEAFADLVSDIAAEMNVGDFISTDAVMPFAKRAATVLSIDIGSVLWLADVACCVLTLANDSVPDDLAVPPGSDLQ